MKASVATATTVLLGPRLEVSDKQLFREMKKTSKAERDKNGKMARSNPTSAARYSLKTKCRSWERNPPTGVASCWDLSGTKGPMTQTSVTTKHLGINIFLKVFFFFFFPFGFPFTVCQATKPNLLPDPQPPHGVTIRTSKESGPRNGLVLVFS